MRKNVLAIIVALACVPAFATGNNQNRQGGNATGGSATGGNATGGTAIANPVANGGAGGAGGRGGEGGSVLGSGNSSSSSGVIGSGNSSNTNVLGQQQGQAQGQQQGQAAIGVGIGGEGGRAVSSSNSGASATSGSTSTSNSGGNTMVGGRQDTTNNNSSGANVTVTGDTYQAQERNPVNTAYAPSIAPTALCALGVSGGAQGVSFGLSFGKSYTDENCVLLEQVRATATVLGDRATAAEMLCEVPAYKAARARAGKPCGGTSAAVATPVLSAKAAPSTCDYKGSDPLVIQRVCK